MGSNLSESDERRCIYCQRKESSSSDSERVEFTREHVVHAAFTPGFRDNLTLVGLVCSKCNQHFGNTIDQKLARGGLEGLLRFDYGLKALSKLNEFDSRNTVMNIVSDLPELNGALVKQSTDGMRRTYEFVPQVGLELNSGIWHFLPVEKFDEFDGHVSNEWTGRLQFLCQQDEDEIRMQGKLEQIFHKIGKKLNITGMLTPGTQSVFSTVTADNSMFRAIGKIGFNYMACTLMPHAPNLPFFDWFDPCRKFILEDKFPDVAVADLLDHDLVSKMLSENHFRDGHLVSLGTLPWNRNDKRLICIVRLFNRSTWCIYLSWNYRGPEKIANCCHFWNLSEKKIEMLEPIQLQKII